MLRMESGYIKQVLTLYGKFVGGSVFVFLLTITLAVPSVSQGGGFYLFTIPPAALLFSIVFVVASEMRRRFSVSRYSTYLRSTKNYSIRFINDKGDILVQGSTEVKNYGRIATTELPPLAFGYESSEPVVPIHISKHNPPGKELKILFESHYKDGKWNRHFWQYAIPDGLLAGETVRYEYTLPVIPSSEVMAFNPDGANFTVAPRGKIYDSQYFQFIAPEGYRFEFMGLTVSNAFDVGTAKKEERRAVRMFCPRVEQFGEVMTWRINWPLPHLTYICRYRLVSKSDSGRSEAASEGANKVRETNLLVEKTGAIAADTAKKGLESAANAVKSQRNRSDISLDNPEERIRILHLSDLHFNEDDDSVALLQPLINDLRSRNGEWGFDQIEYLVVSGDLTNHGVKPEFDRAYEFLRGLIEEMKLTEASCIIAPGNHDLSWQHNVYEWKPKRMVEVRSLKSGSYVEQGDGYLLRIEGKYSTRFESFRAFYHELIKEPYPPDAETQCVNFLFSDDRIQFLAMNSAWEIDEYFKERSGINERALARGLRKANEQLQNAGLDEDAPVLRIAVWHHPVTGDEKITKDSFLEQLQQQRFKLCLHGHVHQDTADLLKYFDVRRRLYVAGAGSFGAPVNRRPESTPRLYNLLELWRNHTKIRIHTRCLRRDGGAWEGSAVWPHPDNDLSRLTYYEINLM